MQELLESPNQSIKKHIKTCTKFTVSQLRSQHFLTNVIKLILGTGSAQIITLLVAPLLTRIYSPEAFGQFSVFSSTVTILSLFATGRYELAIMLPDDEEEAFILVILNVLLCFVVSTLLLFLAFVIQKWEYPILREKGIEPLHQAAWLIPVGIFLLSLGATIRSWLNRQSQYTNLAKLEIVESVTANSVQISLATFLLSNFMGLITGRLVGDLLYILVGVKLLMPHWRKIHKKKYWKQMYFLAKRYNAFPLYTLPSGLLNTINNEMPSLLLFLFFGPNIAGLYALTVRLLSRPIDFISSAVKNVFYREFISSKRLGKNISQLLLKVSGLMLLISLAPTIVICIFAPYVVGRLFGEEWIAAGQYIRLLAPCIVAQFVISATSLSMYAMNKQRIILIWTILYLLLGAAAFLFGKLTQDPFIAIAAYSAISVAMYFAYFGLNLYFTQKIQHNEN
ncbi:MAG: oligosaccharide flippase family protein [Caldilineaceae bacterium]